MIPKIHVKYRRWVGLPYEPPFGCFYLVRDFFGEDLIPDYAKHLDPKDREVALIRGLIDITTPVEEPQEEDIVVFRIGGKIAHVGIVVAPGYFLHSFSQAGQSCIEPYESVRWQNRLDGFYRLKRSEG